MAGFHVSEGSPPRSLTAPPWPCRSELVDSVNDLASELDGASLLWDVTRLYVRAQRQTVACCGPESAARCHVLGELARSGPLRLTDLAARLDADKSWTSRTVAAMVKEGLLSCGGADTDARVVHVALTPAGRARWQGMDAALRRQAEGALSRLSREERRIVHRGLALLRCVLAGEPIARPGRVSRPKASRSRNDHLLTTPSTDPDVRSYRIRLLPWVVTAKRTSGQGWQMRAGGSQRWMYFSIRRHGRRWL